MMHAMQLFIITTGEVATIVGQQYIRYGSGHFGEAEFFLRKLYTSAAKALNVTSVGLVYRPCVEYIE